MLGTLTKISPMSKVDMHNLVANLGQPLNGYTCGKVQPKTLHEATTLTD